MVFYHVRVERLSGRLERLRAELASVEVEFERVRATRDQVRADRDRSIVAGPVPAPTPGGEDAFGDDVPAGAGLASPGEASQAPSPRPVRQPRGPLAESAVRLLAAVGRPMRVRELNEALGRPEIRTQQETLRTTCNRLVREGVLTRVKTGLYTVARTDSGREGVA